VPNRPVKDFSKQDAATAFFDAAPVPCCILSEDATLLRVNEAMGRLLDCEARDLEDTCLVEFGRSSQALPLPQRLANAHPGELFEVELTLALPESRRLEIVMELRRAMDEPVFWASLQDVTEERRDVRRLRQTSTRMGVLNEIASQLDLGTDEKFEHALTLATNYLGMETGIVSHIHGEHYDVMHCYPQSEGLRPGARFPLGDTYCSITLGADKVLGIEHMSESVHQAHPCFQAFQLECYLGVPIDVDGERFGTLNFSCTSPRSEPWSALDIEFVSLMGRWVAQALSRASAQQQLLREQERLRLFIKRTPSAVAMFDKDMRYLAISDRWAEDYKLGEEDLLGRSHYEVFPEVPERWKEIHRRCLEGDTEACEEDVFERADGRLEYLRWEIQPWREHDGSVGGLVFFTEVITERKEQELALSASERRFRTLVDLAPVGIYLTNKDGLCKSVNRTWERLAGMPEEKALGTGWSGAIHPDDREAVFERWTESARRNEDFSMEFRWRHPDGTVVWTQSDATALRDEHGEIESFVGTIADITGRKEYEAVLRNLADRDGLTGLYNRRIFSDLMAREFATSLRYTRPLTLLVLDLDHFKQINDVHGHDSGDVVLKRTAEILRRVARESDIVARWGGEEFVVLLPQTEAKDGLLLAGRLR